VLWRTKGETDSITSHSAISFIVNYALQRYTMYVSMPRTIQYWNLHTEYIQVIFIRQKLLCTQDDSTKHANPFFLQ